MRPCQISKKQLTKSLKVLPVACKRLIRIRAANLLTIFLRRQPGARPQNNRPINIGSGKREGWFGLRNLGANAAATCCGMPAPTASRVSATHPQVRNGGISGLRAHTTIQNKQTNTRICKYAITHTRRGDFASRIIRPAFARANNYFASAHNALQHHHAPSYIYKTCRVCACVCTHRRSEAAWKKV